MFQEFQDWMQAARLLRSFDNVPRNDIADFFDFLRHKFGFFLYKYYCKRFGHKFARDTVYGGSYCKRCGVAPDEFESWDWN